MSAAVQSFDYYHKWLGIPPAEQPPNHYRLLGIANFEADPDVIETAAEQRMAHVRARQTGKHTAASQKLLNEIAAARVQLLQPEHKMEYDAGLRQALAAATAEANQKLPRATVLAADVPAPIPAFAPRPAAASTAKKSGFPARAAIALGAVGVLLIVGTLVAIPLLLGQPGDTTADSQPSVPPIPATGPTPKPETSPAAQDPPDQSPPAPPPTPAPERASQATDNPPGETLAEPPPPAAPPEARPPTISDETPIAAAGEPEREPPASGNTATEANASENTDQRLPVPDAASLDKARQTVKDIYAAQFAAAKQPEQKAKIAGEILGQAQVTLDDPAGKYVLLDTARRVGEQAGDLPLTLRACDVLAKSFQINPLPLKESALEACRKLARQAGDWQRLAEASLAAVDEALAAPDYAAAERVAETGLECARKSRDKELITRSAARAKEVIQLAAAYAQAKDAFERLRTDPQDAASHLVVGRFLCFDKRDWQAGLSHLAQGSDPDLAALAKQDQDGETKSETWTELAEKWLARSKVAKASEQKASEERAAFWYRNALPTLTGLSRVKVEKALETLPKSESVASTKTSPRPAAPPKRLTTPNIPPELKLIGAWKITYTGGAIRNYQFDGRGGVFFVELKQTGRLAKRGEDFVLDFGDGKLERLRIVDDEVLIDHFDPAGQYPDSPTLRGRAEPAP